MEYRRLGASGVTVPLFRRPTFARVLIGARNEQQIKYDLREVGWNLTGEQIKKLDAASATTKLSQNWHAKRLSLVVSNECPECWL